MRKFLVFIAGAVLLFLLFVMTTSAILVVTVTPAHLKKWLREGGVYTTVVDTLTKQGQSAVAGNGGNADSSQPAVQAAIKTAVTPAFLQTSTEQFIDGVTPWLNGKSAKPTFSIDVSNVKQTFLQSLANQARARYATLPACPAGQVPDASSDIFSISCQIPGLDINAQIQQAIDDFNAKQDFLANPVITADTLQSDNNGVKEPVFQKLDKVPDYYKWARISPFVFGVLALLSILIIVFASTERRKGVRRVMLAFGFTGLALLAGVLLSKIGVNQAQKSIAKNASKDSVVQNTVIEALKSVQHDFNNATIIFGVAFLVLAAGLLIYLLITKPKSPGQPDKSAGGPADEKPEPADKSEPKKTAPKPPRLVQITE